jgi:hypothetical protein
MGDYVGLDCATAREAISAMLDAEDPRMIPARLIGTWLSARGTGRGGMPRPISPVPTVGCDQDAWNINDMGSPGAGYAHQLAHH